ncbi:MAG: FimV/HubP family polar landmark protein [Pseudomonadota bacterium]|nr:FimV/HubP family polar landmark protein [Pseudomonadota bacterium]
MKVRKLAVALALAGGLGSGMANALGLGEIELQSWLNEPLDADISLRQSQGVDPGDVFVNVAPEEAYNRVGLERNSFLRNLRFEVVTGADGNLTINVSSREPVREPYLNFLLELTWPNGRLLREYAVLVDPPVYGEESGLEQQVAAPAASSAPAPAPSRPQESQRRQAEAERSLGQGYQADTFGPTGPSDTLWTIAQQVRPDRSVSMQQVMLAIQDQNPNAFIDGNINRLKRGEVLRVPTLEQMRTRSQAEASRIVAQQNEAFQSPRAVDATAETQTAQGQAQSAGGAELRLIASEDTSEQRSTEEGGSAGGDGDATGGVDTGSAVAMEELEAARRQNDELSGRVEDLQDQVATLQRLLELKNSQLADLQGMAAEGGEAPEGEPAAPGAADEMTATGEAEPESPMDESVAGEPDTEAGDAGVASETDEQVVEGGAEEGASEGESAEESAGDDQVAMDDEMAQEPVAEQAEPEEQAPAPAVSQQPAAQQPAAQQPAAAPEKGFPGNIIDAIVSNPMYQIALGGGLILLLLLLLLVARRNANREKEFYDQFNSDEGDDKDTFNLDLGDEESGDGEGSDALTEAETYIAYGRHDQAAQVLETAISREPSRADLRLKLLAVYADSQDRESFEKQFNEVAALDDEAALAEAEGLRARLEEAESMPSIDDLESQLRSDSFSTAETVEDLDDQVEDKSPDDYEEDWSLADELKADESEAETARPVEENEFGELESDVAEETSDRDDLIEYDLSGLKEDGSDADESEETDSLQESDFASLDLELDEPEEKADSDDLSIDFETTDSAQVPSEENLDLTDLEESLDEARETEASAEKKATSDLDDDDSEFDEILATEDAGDLDESFLDELDAELDKVASEDGDAELDLDDSTLDDLELDVSDEDLALMEEFSEQDAESDKPAAQQESPLDEELGLEDALDQAEENETPEDDLQVPVASEAIDETGRGNATPDIDESDLGEEDDFDFLAGTDEAATKLDLARAYIEMGDTDGAKDILEEVALEGNDEQKAEAQELLKNLS